MKKIFFLFLIINSVVINAQNVSGQAYYKSFHSLAKMNDTISRTPAQEKLRADLAKQIQSQLQKEYKLTFKDGESTYMEEAKLEVPKPAPSGGITITIGQSNDIFYRNLKDSTYVNETEILGKPFLVEDKLKPINWKLEKETKLIGQYTCFKATYSRQEIKDKYDYQKEEIYQATETVVTTAWYTPQIPLSQGPDEYWGLPGLILEINEGELSLLCYKVVLNPSEEINIKVPSKGKKVDQDEFDVISEKKEADMRERMKNFKKG